MSNALLDLLRGMSNSAAANVSAPVDAIAWLLKNAGVNTGTPVGGSDWMRSKGLTSDTTTGAGYVGEGVGGIIPLVAAAKAPQIAAGLNAAINNAAAPSTMLKSGQRGMAYIPKEDLIEKLKSAMSSGNKQNIGLRVLPDEQALLNVGDEVPASFKWRNGEITEKQLHGSSAAGVGSGTDAEILQAIRNLGLYENGPNGYYSGKKIALIAGNSARKGEDIGEKVIDKAKILWIDDNPRYAK